MGSEVEDAPIRLDIRHAVLATPELKTYKTYASNFGKFVGHGKASWIFLSFGGRSSLLEK